MEDTKPQDHEEQEKAQLAHWAIVVGIAVLFLIWGLTNYFMIGDKGPPVWDYSVIEDIPGQSPYSTSSVKQFPGNVQHPVQEQGKVVEQHVDRPHPNPALMPSEEGKP